VATRKQRRRREKEGRHEYEYVYVDDQGNEVETPDDAPAAENGARQPPARRSGTKPNSASKAKPAQARGGREVQPPSWRRTIRRGLIFAPIFLATVLLLGGGKLQFAAALFQTLLLLVIFVPFSYFMDRLVYRSWLKKTAKS
jgi:hypothetical protein